MKYYLVKSLKWTKIDGIETWWETDSCGYTTFICNAGVYSEEDKKKMQSEIKQKSVAFIPLTQQIISKGKEQLKEKIENNKKYIIELKERYESAVKATEKQIELAKSKENELLAFEAFIES